MLSFAVTREQLFFHLLLGRKVERKWGVEREVTRYKGEILTLLYEIWKPVYIRWLTVSQRFSTLLADFVEIAELWRRDRCTKYFKNFKTKTSTPWIKLIPYCAIEYTTSLWKFIPSLIDYEGVLTIYYLCTQLDVPLLGKER